MIINLDKREDCKYAGELHLPPSKSWHQVLETICKSVASSPEGFESTSLPGKNSSPIGWFELANHGTISLSQSCTNFWYKALFIVRIWTSHIGVFTFRNKRLSSPLKINCDSYTCQKEKFMFQKLDAYLMWRICHTSGSFKLHETKQ
jgi:hypothetical protein